MDVGPSASEAGSVSDSDDDDSEDEDEDGNMVVEDPVQKTVDFWLSRLHPPLIQAKNSDDKRGFATALRQSLVFENRLRQLLVLGGTEPQHSRGAARRQLEKIALVLKEVAESRAENGEQTSTEQFDPAFEAMVQRLLRARELGNKAEELHKLVGKIKHNKYRRVHLQNTKKVNAALVQEMAAIRKYVLESALTQAFLCLPPNLVEKKFTGNTAALLVGSTELPDSVAAELPLLISQSTLDILYPKESTCEVRKATRTLLGGGGSSSSSVPTTPRPVVGGGAPAGDVSGGASSSSSSRPADQLPQTGAQIFPHVQSEKGQALLVSHYFGRTGRKRLQEPLGERTAKALVLMRDCFAFELDANTPKAGLRMFRELALDVWEARQVLKADLGAF